MDGQGDIGGLALEERFVNMGLQRGWRCPRRAHSRRRRSRDGLGEIHGFCVPSRPFPNRHGLSATTPAPLDAVLHIRVVDGLLADDELAVLAAVHVHHNRSASQAARATQHIRPEPKQDPYSRGLRFCLCVSLLRDSPIHSEGGQRYQ